MKIKITTQKKWEEYLESLPKKEFKTIETSDEDEIFVMEQFELGKSIDALTKKEEDGKIYASRYNGNLIEEITEDDLMVYQGAIALYDAIKKVYPGL